MSVGLIVIAAVILALSGLPAVLLRPARRRAEGGQPDVRLSNRRPADVGANLGVLMHVVACGLAAMGLLDFALEPEVGNFVRWAWTLPVGQCAVGLDALSGWFLVPIFLIATLGSIYGLGYWAQDRHPGNAIKLRVSWGLLGGAMAMVVLARNGVVFLMAWEIMALAAFLLVATEDHKKEVRQAGWVYLVATHTGTLCLFGMFALLKSVTGTFDLWPAALSGISSGTTTAIFILGLVGFGMKAGLFPLHVWLPGAHANAPSQVSAILSGVMLKMGVYGLLRMTGLLALPPVWWGALLLALGSISALLGIAYAVGQRDYKKLLAYSSIENIGIITMGLGLALLGQASGHRAWVVLGMAGALLHVLNHSLFKPMLFLGAGSVLHAVHTRNMDRLGGLGKRMPWTYAIFVLGGIAICGLPPLNGFVSELLLYLGLLGTTQTMAGESGGNMWSWAALAVPVLAGVGALAVSGFVKLIGGVFQGEARGGHAHHAHDPGPSMRWPMAVLAGLCVGIGIFPMVVVPWVAPAVRSWAGGEAVRVAWLPGSGWQWLNVAAAGGMAVVVLGWVLGRQSRRAARAGTWDCGYARPTARMQYTGTSLGQMVVDLFMWALFPRTARVRLRKLFPRTGVFVREVPDAVLDRMVVPAFSAVRRTVVSVRVLHHNSVRSYLIYILLILVVLVLL